MEMEVVEMLPQAFGAAENTSLPAAVEHQELLVRHVELPPCALQQAAKAGFIRRIAGCRSRFGERRHERLDGEREFTLRRAGADHAAANRHEGVPQGADARHGRVRVGDVRAIHSSNSSPSRATGRRTTEQVP